MLESLSTEAEEAVIIKESLIISNAFDCDCN